MPGGGKLGPSRASLVSTGWDMEILSYLVRYPEGYFGKQRSEVEVRSWERRDIWRGISVTGKAWHACEISKQNEGQDLETQSISGTCGGRRTS